MASLIFGFDDDDEIDGHDDDEIDSHSNDYEHDGEAAAVAAAGGDIEQSSTSVSSYRGGESHQHHLLHDLFQSNPSLGCLQQFLDQNNEEQRQPQNFHHHYQSSVSTSSSSQALPPPYSYSTSHQHPRRISRTRRTRARSVGSGTATTTSTMMTQAGAFRAQGNDRLCAQRKGVITPMEENTRTMSYSDLSSDDLDFSSSQQQRHHYSASAISYTNNQAIKNEPLTQHYSFYDDKFIQTAEITLVGYGEGEEDDDQEEQSPNYDEDSDEQHGGHRGRRQRHRHRRSSTTSSTAATTSNDAGGDHKRRFALFFGTVLTLVLVIGISIGVVISIVLRTKIEANNTNNYVSVLDICIQQPQQQLNHAENDQIMISPSNNSSSGSSSSFLKQQQQQQQQQPDIHCQCQIQGEITVILNSTKERYRYLQNLVSTALSHLEEQHDKTNDNTSIPFSTSPTTTAALTELLVVNPNEDHVLLSSSSSGLIYPWNQSDCSDVRNVALLDLASRNSFDLERYGLIVLYLSMEVEFSDWKIVSNNHICDWPGMFCEFMEDEGDEGGDHLVGGVSAITTGSTLASKTMINYDLYMYQVHPIGTIPPEVGLLSHMSVFDGGGVPEVTGSIPSEFGMLDRLSKLQKCYKQKEKERTRYRNF